MIIEKSFDFDDVARQINQFVASGYLITAAIMQSDDGVLVNNRLDKKYRLSMKFRISIKFLSICWQQLRWLRQVGVFLNCQIRMELPLSLILIQRQQKYRPSCPGLNRKSFGSCHKNTKRRCQSSDYSCWKNRNYWWKSAKYCGISAGAEKIMKLYQRLK